MTFSIVSNWKGPEFEQLADLTIPNRSEYAIRQGYVGGLFKFPGHFGKIAALLEAWTSSEWLWWLDIDAIITNPVVRLEDLTTEGDVVLSCDAIGLNSGSMLLRTIPEVRVVLEAIWKLRKGYDVAPWHDQNGLAYQLWTIRERVLIVPKRALNSYPADWRPGDFVLHCPGIPNRARFKILEQRLRVLRGESCESELSSSGI